MPDAQGVEQELVADLSRQVIARAAPEELPLFQATSAAYFRDPGAVSARSRDEMLGFGVDALAAFTPVALYVATAVVTFLVGEATKALKDESGEAVRRFVKRLFKRDDDGRTEPPPPPLSQEQLQRVRDIALRNARSLLPETQATLLAEAMVGSFAAPA